MLYAYIGAAAVIGILIGFVLLCVIWISRKVSEGIRIRTIDLISAYDVLLETRSRELEELEAEIERHRKALAEKGDAEGHTQGEECTVSSGAILNAAERIGAAAYRDAALGQTYQKIKSAFQVDPSEILRALENESENQGVGPAARLLSDLSYDTVYQLSTIPGQEQSQLLRECLNEDALALLDGYQATHKEFSAIGFYDYLRAVAAMEPQRPRLRVSSLSGNEYPDGVEVIVDPDICEGFQIEFNNTLYDYCIKGRELS